MKQLTVTVIPPLEGPLLVPAGIATPHGCVEGLEVAGGRIEAIANETDLGLFAAQFALSHACWLVTYPLAGWIGATAGPSAAALALAVIGAAGLVAVLRLWPAHDPDTFAHSHDTLPLDHPHLKGERHHTHRFVVDDEHPRWASQL
jgi:hypothetical protein